MSKPSLCVPLEVELWGAETKFTKLIHLFCPHTLLLSLFPPSAGIVFYTKIHVLAGTDTPDPIACHGCSPVRATETSLASIRDSELPSGLYKNNGKPTIDRNFFKSMAKTIEVNLCRASKADADVVDEEGCTRYTGAYTSNSCGGKTAYLNWIEGDALQVRIELKFRLIREKMLALAPEASNNLSLRSLRRRACIQELS